MVVHEAALCQSRDFKPKTVQWGLLSAQFQQFWSQPVLKWNAPFSNRSVRTEQVILMEFLVQQRPHNTRCVHLDSLQLQQHLFSVRQPCLKFCFLPKFQLAELNPPDIPILKSSQRALQRQQGLSWSRGG